MKNLSSISHPVYIEYEALRKICLRILRNEGVSIFDGISSDKVEGILLASYPPQHEYVCPECGHISYRTV